MSKRSRKFAPGWGECIACAGAGTSSRGGPCLACEGSGTRPFGVGAEAPARAVSAPAIAQHSAKSVEHYTPAPIVEAARTVLGGIDLDPASCSLANEVIKAEAFYGPGGLAPDGLVEPWIGRVFLNPPGGLVPDAFKGCGTRSNAALWWATLSEAWRTGEVEAAIFVGFTLEVLRAAQALDVPQPIDFPICVPKSRIAFDVDTDGKRGASTSPTHGNVIVYLPPAEHKYSDEDKRRFVETFTPIGRCRA